MKVLFTFDEHKQPYLLGYVLCPQLDRPRQVQFYLDTGSTITTLLDIDVLRLGINWRNLEQAQCTTATGTAFPFVMPDVTVYLKVFDGKATLVPFKLDKIHLMPPEDPTDIYPVQYEFGFSLLFVH